jgi:hypothetical protein
VKVYVEGMRERKKIITIILILVVIIGYRKKQRQDKGALSGISEVKVRSKS